MRRAKSVLYLFALAVCLARPFAAVAAGDPVAGGVLFHTAFTGLSFYGPLSCSTSGCHGGYTGANNPNNVRAGANRPDVILTAINSNTGNMGVFSGRLSSKDLDDLAAYIAAPNVTGGSPTVSVSAATLAFGDQTVGTTGIAKAVTLSNTGSGPLSITGVSASGDFVQTNDCGTAVAAGASCTINVSFRPTAPGTRSGTLVVIDDAVGSPHTVALSGTAVNAGGVTLSTTSLSFASQAVGTSSAAQSVTLTSNGSAALTVSSVAISNGSGDFAQTNDCTTVAAGASCVIAVTFAPAAEGERTGMLTITDSGAGSPRTVGLLGTGVAVKASKPPTLAQASVVKEIGPLASPAYRVVVGPEGNLWFTETSAGKIVRMTLQGAITEYAIPSANSQPKEIVVGSDGNLWFTESAGDKIGKLTPAGALTEYPLAAGSRPGGIAAGPDGNLWFTEDGSNKIGRISTDGIVTEYSAGLSSASGLTDIAAGSDGNLWFTATTNRVGRIDPTSGAITEYDLPTAGNDPTAIVAGPDGALWFTMTNANKIGRIDPQSGRIAEYSGLTPMSGPTDIVADPPGGQFWFCEATAGRVAAISTDGDVTEYSLSSSGTQPTGVVIGPDKNLWVTEVAVNKVLAMATVVSGPSTTPAPSSAGYGGGAADVELLALLALSLLFLSRRKGAALNL
jgi:virginiamycin B lyase